MIKQITEQLEKHGRLTPQELHYKMKGAPAMIQVHAALKTMVDNRAIELKETEDAKFYTVVKKENLEPHTEEKLEKKKPAVKEKHTGKFVFNKVALSKSQCALHVVTEYVEKQKPTLEKLKETFPDKIVSQFGVVKPLKEAQGLSQLRSRYHLKDQQILTTSDDQKVAVTNQWTQDRFQQLLEIAETLGYKVKPE